MSKERSSQSWTLSIRAIPNASRNEIIGWDGDVLKVKLRAVPEDGKANKELVRFFSKFFKIPKSSIMLEKGDKSRRKQLSICGLSREVFAEKIGSDK